MSVLYITYDGLTEAIGQSQVLSYVTRLRALGHIITVLSFEKRDAPMHLIEETSRELSQAGIRWVRLRYHKSPTVPATAYDVTSAVLAGLRVVMEERVRILHARSYIPALICMTLKSMTGARFIFDTRNFWANEKVDGGHWKKEGSLFRATKRMERNFFASADHVVTLTQRARAEISGFDYLHSVPPITVIPTCADLTQFRRSAASKPPGNAPIVVYSGSVGGRYQDVVVGQFFAAIQKLAPEATLQIWSRQETAKIVEAAVRFGAPAASIKVRAGSRQQVAEAVSTAHVGLSFLTEGFSNRSSMPTKVAEYLAAGLLVVSSPGIGDFDELLKGGAGVLLPSVESDDAQIAQAAARTIDLLRDAATPVRARNLAESTFSLERGVSAYDSIYRSLLSLGSPNRAA